MKFSIIKKISRKLEELPISQYNCYFCEVPRHFPKHIQTHIVLFLMCLNVYLDIIFSTFFLIKLV